MPYEYSDWTSVVSETTGTAYTRSASDVGTLSDATGRERGRIYQRYALTDNVTVENLVVRLVLADEELSDSILRELVAARTVNDAPFLEDYIERETGREFVSEEGLVDSLALAVDYARELTEDAGLSDSASWFQVINGLVSIVLESQVRAKAHRRLAHYVSKDKEAQMWIRPLRTAPRSW